MGFSPYSNEIRHFKIRQQCFLNKLSNIMFTYLYFCFYGMIFVTVKYINYTRLKGCLLIVIPISAHCILRGHTGPVYSTCFTDGGCFLLSASEDTTGELLKILFNVFAMICTLYLIVRLWSIRDMECLVCYRGHNYPVWGVSSRWASVFV